MTRKQQLILLSWALAVISILVLGLFEDWVLKNWSILRWPSGAFILCVALLSKGNTKGIDFNEIANEHPWVKVYLIIYCFGVVLFYFLASSNSDIVKDFGFIKIFLAAFGIIFPFAFIQQREVFKSAGKKI